MNQRGGMFDAKSPIREDFTLAHPSSSDKSLLGGRYWREGQKTTSVKGLWRCRLRGSNTRALHHRLNPFRGRVSQPATRLQPRSRKGSPIRMGTRARIEKSRGGPGLMEWCRLRDSNTRPPHYECDALPAELRRRIKRRGGCRSLKRGRQGPAAAGRSLKFKGDGKRLSNQRR